MTCRWTFCLTNNTSTFEAPLPAESYDVQLVQIALRAIIGGDCGLFSYEDGPSRDLFHRLGFKKVDGGWTSDPALEAAKAFTRAERDRLTPKIND